MKKTIYPLLEDAFNKKDISIAKKIVDTKQLTMSKHTSRFEKEFANYVGSKYAVMVNSGSSANLLSVFVAKHLNNIKPGDEAIIPSVCWSTSLWPLVQAGLKPIFVDVDPKNFNASVKQIYSKITKKTKILMLIHVLGTCLNISKVNKILKNKKIIVIEDTCESLGTRYKNKYLGTFGDFGTYSFYYSHQITSGEGGMVVTNKKKNYEMLKIMRAHGWDRDITKKKSKSFNFVSMGFNLRPLEISAGIASNQLKRLNHFSKIRNLNREKIIKSLQRNYRWNKQYSFSILEKNTNPSWFGLPLILNKNYLKYKKEIINNLNKKGIETRPIISGNFLNQKATKLYNLNPKKNIFPNADYVEKAGFFIGLHTTIIKQKTLELITDTLLKNV